MNRLGKRSITPWVLLICAQVFAFALSRMNLPQQDFLSFYAATRIGLSGHNPYDQKAIDAEFQRLVASGSVKDQFYLLPAFNPPEMIVAFAPLAQLPWNYASWAWLATQLSLAVGLGTLARSFGGGETASAGLAALIVIGSTCNLLTYRLLSIGQCTLWVAAMLAMGQWAFEKRRPFLGAWLWGLAAIKPHLVIPFLLVAFVLGGWRRLGLVLLTIGILNVAGAYLAMGSIRGLLIYTRFLSENFLLGFNRVDRDQITSWTRSLLVLGGPSVDLKGPGVLAGNAFWAALVWLRLGMPWQREKLGADPAYLIAVAGVGSVYFALTKGYDLIMLVFLAPFLRDCWRLHERKQAIAVLTLLALLTVPRLVVDRALNLVHAGASVREFCLSYRSLITGILAAYLLVRGPHRNLSLAPAQAGPIS